MPRIQQKLSVDFGSAFIRMQLASKEYILKEPSCIAKYYEANQADQFMALGSMALQMQGRVSKSIRVIKPIQDGDIVNFEAAEDIFKRLIHRIQGRMLWMGPHVVICIPSQIHQVQRRAIQRLCTVSGARKITLVERSLAVARAIGLTIDDPHGHMVVDIGHETTEISIISLGQVVHEHRLKVAGKHFSRAIAAAIKLKFKIEISMEFAEDLKLNHLNLRSPKAGTFLDIKGRCSETSLPKLKRIALEELNTAVSQPLSLITDSISNMLSVCSTRLATDISQSGVVLVGGTALMKGIGYHLRRTLKVPFLIPLEPDELCVRGAQLFE